ncbi:hypothetical protein CLU96_0599 [Chryseobacterium sp. 52]|uniref:hypothetical protein n=1 Tax=Chryseobacterium sp. 52 TaxID=2035213 RepID=UPI000C175753|nr:hypothetical protein [Chryseobacterium sp. 52]PIF43687.1 hypothetical protein CLU96_0599 [Chryseobacterium sp. 52]
MSDIKKLVNDLTFKGTSDELWFDPKNYETKESSNNYFHSPFYSGYVGDIDIPFKVRLPLSTVEKELKIDAILSSEVGYITIRPGRDINYNIKIDTGNKKIEYILTYYYTQAFSKKDPVALILKTNSVFDFVNLLNSINIKPANESFINDEFRKSFSRVESDDSKLDWLYENAYPSAIKDRGDEQLWTDLLRLSKFDGNKWFVDTGSAIMNIAQSFSNEKWIINKLKNNQETLMEVYNTISDYNTKFAFVTLISSFLQIEGDDLYKPTFLKGKKYKLSCVKSVDENKSFRIINEKNIGSGLAPSIGGGVSVPYDIYQPIEIADLNPCDLVIIKDADIKIDRKNPIKTSPGAAIMLYYMSDNENHEELVKMVRITLDVAAILAAVYSGGTSSLLIRFAEAGLAVTDIAMMDDGIRKFLSENGGEWFVENWDTIYLMTGLGFLSRIMIRGILTKGPALLESLKNVRNIPKNLYLFRKDLEKLIKELEAYEARQAARITVNEIEEIVIKVDKYGLWRKVLNLASSPEKYLEKIVQDLATKGLSARKTEEGLYEVLYNGKPLFKGKDYEVGNFLKQEHFKSFKAAEEFANRIALATFRKMVTNSANLRYKGIVYEVTKNGGILKWKFPDELSTFPNRADLSEYGVIEYNFKIPDKLLKKPYGGFGQKFLDESFEIYGNDIKGASASWNEYESYPGGSSLGYKQFWKAFNEFGDKNEALKTTTFYKTMNKKGISIIEESSVSIDDYDNSVSVIIYNKDFNK